MAECLPAEVVESILWRLPVESIIKCRCVCKSWYSLISTANFISNHLRNNNNTQTVLHQRKIYDKSEGCLLFFDNQNYFRAMLLHLPHPARLIRIVESCNGLICFSIGRNYVNDNDIVKFVVCNPSIAHFLTISLPQYMVCPVAYNWCIFGFGFDERSRDYKILVIRTHGLVGNGIIYSLNSNSWSAITSPIPTKYRATHDNSVFVNGGFHWSAVERDYNLIMVFDVNGETFGQISLPECLANSEPHNLTVKEFGESSIAVIQQTFMHDNDTDIWVMKEYGCVESWMKLASIGKSWISDARVLGFRNKNEVLISLLVSGHIASQNINSKVVKNMMDVDTCPFTLSLHKYVPSLVLLDKQNYVDVLVAAAPTPTRRKQITKIIM
ncbi:F-box/kelch-repeat protein At3g23880-like [Euphorbia lathyris]|uniref:F-box/kelch-repeat protein At3g23880-like n=1 Tax=Euphorbia lathyris TaxID=212925 RepID=UPI003313605E